MKYYPILAIGEVLFDVIENEYRLGGAPFNVAAHLANLGHKSYILSGVGRDDLGRQILTEASHLNVNTKLIHQHATAPTGTVAVTFEDGEPQYEIVENVAWDFLQIDLGEIISVQWEVVVFGSLAQRSLQNQKFFSSLFQSIKSKWRFFDCNLRQQYYDRNTIERSLKWANICKFNEAELRICSQLLYGEIIDPEKFATQINQDFHIELVVYTLGKRGSSAWYQGRMYARGTEPVKVKDTIGAGDAFNAGFLHHWIAEGKVGEALEYGNKLGAYVASCSGAIPEYDDEIKTIFSL
ncbi:MAG TPA: carbohydrate kinase [Membranihabitans sp.]|nr:carbohydrate kinase [Membranihabitans sp.]